ncbi:hypothetical protein LR48_Vigan07g120700 [Vigna angularis]|uniref:VOC domain-containing protein n=1 Tax=Phaseolus angularis TaxID=3914 RepID=A0A0L9UXL7_PHAAN|nr:hypothetical protein LR48_Vigan07g120700 [Vigna angularis]
MQQKVVKGEERKIARKAEDSRNENRTPLMALNHISRLCRNVKESIDFYTKVLGFVQTKRPQALDSKGARLFNYGVDIHLVQSKEEDQRLPSNSQHLDPQENHISFQCEDLEAMEKKLKKMNVKFMKRTIEAEDGTFFSSPMCNTTNQSFKVNLMKEVKKDRDGIRKELKKCKRREAVSTAQRQFTAERHSRTPVGSVEV